MKMNICESDSSGRRAIGRRDFLASTASLGVGFMLAQSAPGQQMIEASKGSHELNVALIGCGAQGKVLMDAAMRIPGIRFKAVCDIWEYNRRYGERRLKAYKHDVTAYEDYRELLTQEDGLDVVLVATPDWMHAEHSIAAMQAGLHVYCEKEMSNVLEKARQMVLASRETGRLLQIGHQRRSNPRYIHAIDRMVLERNLLGRVTQAYGQWNRAKSEDLGWPAKYEIDAQTLEKYGYESMHHFRNWRWYKRYGGGPIVDLGSHQIDIFSWVFEANPKTVMAGGGIDFYPHHEWYDNVMAIYEYETPQGLSRAMYQVLTTTSNGQFFENFMGEDGTLAISELPHRGNHFLRENHVPEEEWEKLVQEGLLLKSDDTPPPPARPDDVTVDVRVSVELGAWGIPVQLNKPAHQPHLENFFDAIRHGTPLNCPPEVGYETAVAVLKVNEAVEAGHKIAFDHVEFAV